MSTDQTTLELIENAKKLFRAGRAADSVNAFERILDEHDDAEAHYGLGVVLLNQGDLDRAEHHLRQAGDRHGGHADAYYMLGQLAERRGDRDRACAWYERALSATAGHPAAGELARLRGANAAGQASMGMGTGRAEERNVSAEAAGGWAAEIPESQLAFSPAEIGTVTKLKRGSESDPDQPLVMTFNRPVLQVVTFELAREGQPPLAVEMRGATLVGPLDNGDRVAIPATPDENGMYRIDQVQRLSALPDRQLVVMQPLVDQPTLNRLAWGAKLRSYVPFVVLAWGIVVVVSTVLLFFLLVLPDIRNSDRAGEAEQRLESQWDRANERFDQQRREIFDSRFGAGFDEQDRLNRAERRIDARADRWLKRWRKRCRASDADESFCNFHGRP